MTTNAAATNDRLQVPIDVIQHIYDLSSCTKVLLFLPIVSRAFKVRLSQRGDDKWQELARRSLSADEIRRYLSEKKKPTWRQYFGRRIFESELKRDIVSGLERAAKGTLSLESLKNSLIWCGIRDEPNQIVTCHAAGREHHSESNFLKHKVSDNGGGNYTEYYLRLCPQHRVLIYQICWVYEDPIPTPSATCTAESSYWTHTIEKAVEAYQDLAE